MPMITKPASIEKNSAAEITLDKTVLASITGVTADDYFSDSSNWSEVLVYFRSSEGNQREILKFDATQASPTANFLVSDKARDAFEVQKIVIKDFDNDSFTVTRSELVVADFDITFGIPAALIIDFTQGSLPVGTQVVNGLSPDMSNGSLRIYDRSSQLNIPLEYTYIANSSYTARVYIKDAAEPSGSLGFYFNSIFRTGDSTPFLEFGASNPSLDIQNYIGSYVEFTFTSGPQFNDSFPLILMTSISPSGSVNTYIEITKIELFENF